MVRIIIAQVCVSVNLYFIELNSNLKPVRIYSNEETSINIEINSGARFFIVLTAMGNNGANGAPSIAFVLCISYNRDEYRVDYINQPQGISVSCELSADNINVQLLRGSSPSAYLECLCIKIR